MTKMELVDAIKKIQYDPSWAIYAEVPFTEESAARFGQTQFENGGLLDSKEFFANGQQVGNWFVKEFEDYPEMLGDEIEVGLAAASFIEETDFWR